MSHPDRRSIREIELSAMDADALRAECRRLDGLLLVSRPKPKVVEEPVEVPTCHRCGRLLPHQGACAPWGFGA